MTDTPPDEKWLNMEATMADQDALDALRKWAEGKDFRPFRVHFMEPSCLIYFGDAEAITETYVVERTEFQKIHKHLLNPKWNGTRHDFQ